MFLYRNFLFVSFHRNFPLTSTVIFLLVSLYRNFRKIPTGIFSRLCLFLANYRYNIDSYFLVVYFSQISIQILKVTKFFCAFSSYLFVNIDNSFFVCVCYRKYTEKYWLLFFFGYVSLFLFSVIILIVVFFGWVFLLQLCVERVKFTFSLKSFYPYFPLTYWRLFFRLLIFSSQLSVWRNCHYTPSIWRELSFQTRHGFPVAKWVTAQDF